MCCDDLCVPTVFAHGRVTDRRVDECHGCVQIGRVQCVCVVATHGVIVHTNLLHRWVSKERLV